MIYCVECDQEIHDAVYHYSMRCAKVDLDRLMMVGLITAEEAIVINRIRNEKRDR